MRKIDVVLLMVLVLGVFGCSESENYVQYVDPLVSENDSAVAYPLVAVPFGNIWLRPDYVGDSSGVVCGFKHLDKGVMNGTGISFMAICGVFDDSVSVYKSRFYEKKGKTETCFYRTFLEDYGIRVEMTATENCAVYKYVFPKTDEASIILDMQEIEAKVEVLSDYEINGAYDIGVNEKKYFSALFSRPFKDFGIHVADLEAVRVNFVYETNEGEEVLVKIAFSDVSIEDAQQRLDREISDWNFKKIKDEAREKWNDELGKVKYDGKLDKGKFYTEVYRSLLKKGSK